jgi:hypothetical protein
MLKIEDGSSIRQYMDFNKILQSSLFTLFACVILGKWEILGHVIIKFLMPRKLQVQPYHFFQKRKFEICKLPCKYCLHMLFSIRKPVLMTLVYRCFDAKTNLNPTILFFPKKEMVT